MVEVFDEKEWKAPADELIDQDATLKDDDVDDEEDGEGEDGEGVGDVAECGVLGVVEGGGVDEEGADGLVGAGHVGDAVRLGRG